MATEYTGDVVPITAQEYTGEVIPLVEEKAPTALERFADIAKESARQIGLTARGVVSKGLAPILDIPAGVASAVVSGANALPGVNLPVPPSDPMQRAYNQLFDIAGVTPRNATERVVQDVVGGMSGAYGTATMSEQIARAATAPIAKAVLSTMGSAPEAQAISGGGAGFGGGVARELGAGPGVQTLSSLIGGALTNVPAAVGSLTRRFLGGGEEAVPKMMERARTFQEAGATTPSAGQVTGARSTQAVESALSKIPGGAGPMAQAAEREASEIGAKAVKIADQLSTTATPATAGAIIEKGISGPDGFINRFKQAQRVLYDKLDQYIPKQADVDVTNTKKTLAALNADIPNAPALSKWFKNAKIQGIEAAMASDTKGIPGVPPGKSPILQESGVPFPTPAIPAVPPKTTLPYESIKKLRTLVGAELDNPSLMTDVPRSKWKALYASLSKDLDNAAVATGNPDAIKAMKRANTFTRAGYDRIDSVLDKVVGKNTPEEIYKSATSTADMQAGATKIASVMKSLEPAERDVVKSAFIRRMGMALPGQQNAAGEAFSTQTFLTNWNKISPQAKAVLFSGKDGEIRNSLDQIAKASQYIKEGSKVFANPSGTAPAAAMIGEAAGVASSAATLLATGHPFASAGVLLGAAAGNYGANITAKMMTNPKFINWLAKSTALPPALLPTAVGTLSKSMEKEPEDVKNDVDSYITATGIKPASNRSPSSRESVPLSKLVKEAQQ